MFAQVLSSIVVSLISLFSNATVDVADIQAPPAIHCLADAAAAGNAQQQEIAACESLYQELVSTYEIEVTGEWKLAELEIMQQALSDLENGVGGQENFKSLLANFEIRREAFYGHAGDGKLAMGQADYFVIWDQAFELGSESARFTFLHETFHTLDMRRRWQLSENFRAVVGGLDDNPVTPDPGDYQPAEGHEWSLYASVNLNEDAAESFAAAMFGGDWEKLLEQDPRLTTNPNENFNDGGRTGFMVENAVEW